MLSHDKVVEYYSSVADSIVRHCNDREVAFAYGDGRYDKRPNILQYKNDVVQMAKKGITSFHLSVERWTNPMMLSAQRYAELRKGFDIIFDIDSRLGIDESKLAAEMICGLLKKYGIRNYGVKFSGRRGFHISIAWEMLPKEINYEPLAGKYPEVPKAVAGFVRERIADGLMKALVRLKGAKNLMELLDEPPDSLSPFYFVEVEKDWGNRHMFRAPYSLNEKTWLASVPVDDIKNFSPEAAAPEKVMSSQKRVFIRGEENEAEALLIDALDWAAMQKKAEKRKEVKKPVVFERKIEEEFFPPCMKLILSGLADGRKRSVFTIVNFLKMMNWTQDEIRERIAEWNSKNRPPLPNATVMSTIRYHERREPAPPANCFNDQFYVSIGVCRPDETCKLIKNPISYPFKKMKPLFTAKSKAKKEARKLYKCGVCNEAFPTPRSLEIHKGRSH